MSLGKPTQPNMISYLVLVSILVETTAQKGINFVSQRDFPGPKCVFCLDLQLNSTGNHNSKVASLFP